MYREEEKLIDREIPENYENGINFAGFSFKTIFLVEGIILGIICFGLMLFIISLFGKITSSSIGIALVPTLGAIFLGIRGINDEPITAFLGNVSRFNKSRRVVYYNPHIKNEAKSIASDEQNHQVLPKDKLVALFTKYKKSLDERNIEALKKEEGELDLELEKMCFEDDDNIVKENKKVGKKGKHEKG